jgi:ssDNA-binding Zn-finger/Zn-ribbon topoisomerase 1
MTGELCDYTLDTSDPDSDAYFCSFCGRYDSANESEQLCIFEDLANESKHQKEIQYCTKCGGTGIDDSFSARGVEDVDTDCPECGGLGVLL